MRGYLPVQAGTANRLAIVSSTVTAPRATTATKARRPVRLQRFSSAIAAGMDASDKAGISQCSLTVVAREIAHAIAASRRHRPIVRRTRAVQAGHAGGIGAARRHTAKKTAQAKASGARKPTPASTSALKPFQEPASKEDPRPIPSLPAWSVVSLRCCAAQRKWGAARSAASPSPRRRSRARSRRRISRTERAAARRAARKKTELYLERNPAPAQTPKRTASQERPSWARRSRVQTVASEATVNRTECVRSR